MWTAVEALFSLACKRTVSQIDHQHQFELRQSIGDIFAANIVTERTWDMLKNVLSMLKVNAHLTWRDAGFLLLPMQLFCTLIVCMTSRIAQGVQVYVQKGSIRRCTASETPTIGRVGRVALSTASVPQTLHRFLPPDFHPHNCVFGYFYISTY